jgi:hypothetical protein
VALHSSDDGSCIFLLQKRWWSISWLALRSSYSMFSVLSSSAKLTVWEDIGFFQGGNCCRENILRIGDGPLTLIKLPTRLRISFSHSYLRASFGLFRWSYASNSDWPLCWVSVSCECSALEWTASQIYIVCDTNCAQRFCRFYREDRQVEVPRRQIRLLL